MFSPVHATVWVDGCVVLDVNEGDAALAAAQTPAGHRFDGAFAGDVGHVVQLRYSFRGEGRGVFTYLKAYKFQITSTHELEPSDTDLTITAFEKGGPMTPLEERPAVRYTSGPLPPIPAPLCEPPEPGAKVVTHHVRVSNTIGQPFRLEDLELTIDGRPILDAAQRDEVIAHVKDGEAATFALPLAEGCHPLEVKAGFVGAPGYRCQVRGKHDVHAVDGGTSDVMLRDRGAAVPLEERPAIEWRDTGP